jgi:methyl coenzyme M reductase subunit C-like uncharacterized protein (methanogenesis marker protein 7)
MGGGEVEVAIVASFLAKRDVNVDACHIIELSRRLGRKYGL